MNIIGWRIYYGDGTVSDSRMTSWDKSPGENVQVVVVFYDVTYVNHGDTRNFRQVLHTYDYFWKLGDQFGCDQAPSVPLGAQVKEGRMTTNENFRALYNRANNDYRFED